MPLWQPGTLDSTVFEDSIEDERERAEVLSKLQTILNDDTFRPKKAQQVDESAVWVENVEEERYLKIKREHGDVIANEVSRAWVEIQKYGDMVSSTNRLPWHAKEKRASKRRSLRVV